MLPAAPPLEAEATLGQCGGSGGADPPGSNRPHLLGGKVHGPLAPAAKARGQTPKVAKQERKKTGRAKRWMQDNQRFVHAVLTFGKNKGPSANS